MDILKLFGFSNEQAASSQHGTLFKELNRILGDLPENEVVFVAGLAGLMGKVAHSDLEFTPEELKHIEVALPKMTAVSEDLAGRVTELLRNLTTDLVGIEDHRYIKMIKSYCPHAQRRDILSALFEVAAADGSITGEEEFAIRNIALELELSDQIFFDVQQKYSKMRSVLRDLPARDS